MNRPTSKPAASADGSPSFFTQCRRSALGVRICVLVFMVLVFMAMGFISFTDNRSFGQTNINFVDGTESSGLDFVHEDGCDEEGYLVSLMGSGVALADFDNDGWIDVYFLNGRKLPIDATSTLTSNGLYRNLGSNRFANISAASRANVSAYSLGVAVADIDNDGFKDIAISNFGSLTLLINNGDGTFGDWTHAAGLSDAGIAFGAGVTFLDIENDGDLDLYVADYVDFTFDRFKQLFASSFPYPPGPHQFEHRPDHLYANSGDGTFVDISAVAGIATEKRPSMGVVCGDFDDDQDTDVFVCCDAEPNLFFRNDGKGKFTQDAVLVGLAFPMSGLPVGSMGAEPGDIDNDSAEDLFVTDYSAQSPIMFKNLGQLGFEDISRSSRIGRDTTAHAKWGAGLFDFDNDGDRDLMIGNGHLIKWANRIEQFTKFKVRNSLLANKGKGVFENVSEIAGDGMKLEESSRGLGFDDLDNDGDVDCVVLNSDAPANYLENRSHGTNNWVQIELVGTTFNRDGVGAKVTIESGALVQSAEVRSGRGYQSHYASRLYFGLGTINKVDRVRVDWLGETSVYSDISVNQKHILKQK